MDLVSESAGGMSRRRRIAFFVVVAIFVALTGLLTPLPFLILGWFLEAPGTVSHKVHEISFGALFALIMAGLVAQFRRPETKIAPLGLVVIPLAVTMLVLVLIANESDPILVVFALFPVAIVALHPARDRLLRPPIDVSAPLMTLVLVAALPLLIFSIQQLETAYDAGRIAPRLLESIPESATEAEFEAAILEGTSPATRQAVQHYGHWSAMGAYSLSLLLLAAIAALRPPGWAVVAWSVGLGVMLYAVASLVYPTDASAHGGVLGVITLLWGAAFLLVAHRERSESRAPASATAGGPTDRGAGRVS
jgi:hypothetical protein